MSSPITRILAAIATAMLVLLIYMTLTVGITGSLFASDRNTVSNTTFQVSIKKFREYCSHWPPDIQQRPSSYRHVLSRRATPKALESRARRFVVL